MKAVISASRRTDIPAFYLRWFMDHIQTGYIDVPNPFNRMQVKRVSLSPTQVAWIVFWSRNYKVFLKNYQFFDSYRLFFHFTINPVNEILEPGMVLPSLAFHQMECLVRIYGPESVVWRYDPMVSYRRNGKIQTNHDIQTFRHFVRTVSSMGIQRCYISVINLYPRVLERSKEITDFEFIDTTLDEKINLLQEMVDVASLYGIRIFSCSNDALLRVQGLRKGHCIDGTLLNRLGHERVTERPHPTRKECGCTHSIDIGDYVNTPCKYGCLYCYARY